MLVGCNLVADKPTAQSTEPGSVRKAPASAKVEGTVKESSKDKDTATKAPDDPNKARLIIKIPGYDANKSTLAVLFDEAPVDGFRLVPDISGKLTIGTATVDSTVGSHNLTIKKNDVPIYTSVLTLKSIKAGPEEVMPNLVYSGKVTLKASVPIAAGVEAWVKVDDKAPHRWSEQSDTFPVTAEVGKHTITVYTTVPLNQVIGRLDLVITPEPKTVKVGP
jgi:hypothetical protein